MLEADAVAKVRAICDALPDSHEEPAWVGTRWRIRTKTYAHVLTIENGWPPAYARAAHTDGPCTVLMFRASAEDAEAFRHDATMFDPPWRADEFGLRLDDNTDWQHVEELVTESYIVRKR